MVTKEKEAREESLGTPVPVERRVEALVPVQTRAIDHSSYSIEKLRESVTSMELDHHNFPSPYEASSHVHVRERWEHLPINKHHSSARHDPVGRLFENLRHSVSEL